MRTSRRCGVRPRSEQHLQRHRSSTTSSHMRPGRQRSSRAATTAQPMPIGCPAPRSAFDAPHSNRSADSMNGSFIYSEDADLCTRLREHGFRVRYVPSAKVIHEGGGSAPRPLQAALRAEARIQYARLHEHGFRYFAFRVAYALHEVLRLPVAALRSRTHLRGRLDAVRASVHTRPRHESSAPSRVS